MTRISLRSVAELDKCRALWERFSPKETMWEDWEIVSCFYSPKLHKLDFLEIIDESGQSKGLLPLWKDLKYEEHCFFGGYYLENMRFWLSPADFAAVFEAMPSRTLLLDMNGKAAEEIIRLSPGLKANFKQEDHRFFLDLEKIGYDLDKHVDSFTKKHRKNFLYDLRKVKEMDYDLDWSRGLANYDEFVRFSAERFGEESDVSNPLFAEQLKRMLSVFEVRGKLFALSVLNKGKVVGVEYGALHNGIFYLINGGHSQEHQNVGKLMVWELMNKAAGLRAREIDCMAGDSGWKELWNLEKDPYYTFTKGNSD